MDFFTELFKDEAFRNAILAVTAFILLWIFVSGLYWKYKVQEAILEINENIKKLTSIAADSDAKRRILHSRDDSLDS